MQLNAVRRRSILAATLAGVVAATSVGGPALAADPTGSITGIVRDTRGAVVPDASVAVYVNPSSDAVQELQADSRGRFTISGLEAGTYKIQIGLGGWSEWAPGRISNPDQAQTYRVRANRTTTANSVVTATGFLAGRLFAPDGKPLANAPVNVTNDNTASQHATLTEADGTFRLRVQPNQTFIVNYQAGALGQYVPHTFDPAQATRFFVRSGQTVRLTDRAAALAGISGRLTDAAGAPAGGVNVSFINVDTINQSDTTTAADGTYDFSGLLEPGRYKVRFSNADGRQYAHQQPDYDSAEIITVASGETVVVDDQLLWVVAPQ
ncbi:carboxypeptidase-like regulatory domain-containing protein [Paractinoplanes lichenicola]|uniref:Carboxypeptidase regulatory-like domain-containing protein n=1 Tax=Paractinoplanes lichenicola TaxID=2802976 RepID=A0ABS1VEJ8_9ACTN|nr:carboxypeptidase-like regulatory domain-containing protein [Actinoplanes lichenicola]MBL7253089.1 carboxypeptidase regulatory-like domain-containing protein [Actinoplanes lichenicola]